MADTGKGAQFLISAALNLAAYNTLNHVVRQLKVDLAHIIDVEVVQDCGRSLWENCRFLLMPRVPNYKCLRSVRSLADYLPHLQILRDLSDSGRLVVYDLVRGDADDPVEAANHHLPREPVIHAKYFSIEAAANLVAEMGARRVYTLGIDGGRSYSSSFADLRRKTLLINGQESFDKQFTQIAKIKERYAMTIDPAIEPMKVFVGTDDSQMVAARVLEHSIRKHASRPVEVTHMLNVPVPTPQAEQNRPKTGFSFARFLIPHLAGYRGRALYLDADMLVFRDLAELWDIPFGGAKVMCTYQNYIPKKWVGNPNFKQGRQLSVMLIDCGAVDWDIEGIVRGLDEQQYTYNQLMHDLCIVPPEQIADRIPAGWNCLEWFEPERASLLHYTVVPSQPWKCDGNPLAHLWHAAFREAVLGGDVPMQLLEQSVMAGHVKYSLLDLIRPDLLGSTGAAEGDASDQPASRDAELNRLRLSLWDSWRDNDQLKQEIGQLQYQIEHLRRKRRPVKRLLKKVRSLVVGQRAA